MLVDEHRDGCSATLNRLVREARGKWLFVLNDDDLLFPFCLTEHARVCGDVDVVYSPPEVQGEDGAQFRGEPPNIPTTALIRRELWERLGGYNETLRATEDRDFYTRAMARPVFARFKRIDYPCWIYRFHGANKSRQQ